MIRRGLFALLGGLIAATSAQAEWLEARSRHFVLYSNSSEATLRKQSEALERLDWGLRYFMRVEEEPEIASRKLTVFMVDDRDVRRLCRCSNAAGFYHSRVSGSIAYSGRGGWTDANNWGRVVLFHEYAHHFLFGTHNAAFPSWYSEGFAEFASTMRIEADQAIIGYPAQHRAYGLMLGEKLTTAQLFDPASRAHWSAAQMDVFYGRGWLLTHYLSFDRDRFIKFQAYIKAINRGVPGVQAGEEAFGDLKALDRELSAYLRRNRLPGLPMRYNGATVPAVTIRRLSAGEAALIDERMTSVRGVDRESGRKLYAKAAPVAARYPDDPIVQGWLAEMAFDAGEDAASLAAAEKALARDPRSVQALLYRGRVRLRQAQDAASKDPVVWNAARASIVAANRADPDDAEPLWWYWQSFAMQGIDPRSSAIEGLYRAQELAPQDESVRFAAAMVRLKAEELPEAKRLLRPLAYDPHAPADNPAARMVAALDAGRKGAEVIAVGEAAMKEMVEKARAAAEAK